MSESSRPENRPDDSTTEAPTTEAPTVEAPTVEALAADDLGGESSAASGVGTTTTNHGKFPVRLVTVTMAVMVLAIGLAQWFAPSFDYQNANILSIVIGFLLVSYAMFVAHRMSAARGNRLLVPATVIFSLIAFVICFRFEGFSGELMPQFGLRFSEKRPNLKDVVDVQATTSGISDKASAKALSDWPQFLGKDRNGVIEQRLFSVPNSTAEAQVLWDQSIGDGWSSFAVSSDRAVTLEQRDAMEFVSCYRLGDGELLWMQGTRARHTNPMGGVGPRSTPAIAFGNVYANGATGQLQCIDLQSGERVWTVDLLDEAGWTQVESETAAPWGHATSPLLIESQGICVVGFGSPVDANNLDASGMTDTPKSLIAVDAVTGEVRWKAGRDQFSYASPNLMNLAGRQQIVSVNEKTVSGHAVESGEQLWSFDWPGSSNTNANCSMAIPAGTNRFLVGKGYGGGSALVEVTETEAGELSAEPVWLSPRVLKTKFNHACVFDDIAYGVSNGSLQAVRISTAEVLWTQPRRSRFEQGQVVLVGDVLVAQAEYGDVVFVATDESEYRELARTPSLSSKTWNIPTVAGRHLLVRNDRQAICYLLPAATP